MIITLIISLVHHCIGMVLLRGASICLCGVLLFQCAVAATSSTVAALNATDAATDTSNILKGAVITKPNCPSKCGDLTVPYPFGVGSGSGCGFQAIYELNCSDDFDPPRAFLGDGDIQVYEISDNQMRISNVVAKSCYDEYGELVESNSVSYDITDTPFSYSDLNKFTLIGCDDLSVISGSSGHDFTSGCISLCSQAEDVVSGSCSGVGCSQISVPKGFKYHGTILLSLGNHTAISSFDPCSYAFLGEAKRFTFQGVSDFSDPNFVQRVSTTVPIVVDWVIGNFTCADVKDYPDYLCKANSTCVDSDTVWDGYRCRCEDGYEGNPYLEPCTDIDECADPSKNNCEEKVASTDLEISHVLVRKDRPEMLDGMGRVAML